MKTSLFCTNSSITLDSGGGIVCYNIIQALKSATLLNSVYCASSVGNLEAKVVNIDPKKYHQPDNPFLYDYFASTFVSDVDIAQFYGAPFHNTVKRLKGAKIICDIAPHNIEESRKEHQNLGLPFPYPHLNDYDLWKFYMGHVLLADVVIVHSKTSAEYIKQKLNLNNEIVVIPHGCNLPAKVPPLPEVFTVTHVGVNGADKGQWYLYEAFNKMAPYKQLAAISGDVLVSPRKIEPYMKCIIAGHGTERWWSNVHEWEIKGLGHVADVTKIYEECSVYVQPTVTEGFGIPALEAMAHGRPVIVTEGCGVSELLEDGKEGFVIPIRDPKAIADKIMYFYHNPSEIERMGKNARQKAEQYTWEKVRIKYQELFR